MIELQHRYKLGQICIFTNRGTSGIKSNDGKRCRITRLKRPDEWATEEPAYVIAFLDENHGFGVRGCELEPVDGDKTERIA